MQDHDLFQRMDDIHKVEIYPLKEIMIDRYEKINIIVGNLMNEVEEQCRHLHAGSIPSSSA